jgi:hypothetical protein
VIETLAAILFAALAKEAPDAFVKLLRAAGVLPADMDDAEVVARIQSAEDVLGNVNPMRAMGRKRHTPLAKTDPASGDYFPPEYEKP